MRSGYLNQKSSVISNSGQNACLAPSSARILLRELKRSQTSFSGHKCIKNVWRPGSDWTRWGSLIAPPRPPSRTCGRFAARVGALRPWRQGAICRGKGGTSPSLALVIPPTERLQTSQAGMHCFPTTGSTTKFTYHGSHFKLNMQQKRSTAGLRPDPLEVQTLIQTPYAPLMWPLRGHGKEHQNRLAAVRGALLRR